MLVTGLMSGTSMDGVTAVAAELEGAEKVSYRLEDWMTVPYPAEVKRALLELVENGEMESLCRLNFAVGEAFAETAAALSDSVGESPDLIGSHGQTVCHLPSEEEGERTFTLQIGEGDVIAERTGVTTVSDFRVRDVAAGGEGAPLIPYLDWKLFRSPGKGRCMLNLGGIANVTYLPPDGDLEDLLAFDTGPGNMIMDYLVRDITDGEREYDEGGKGAARGEVDRELLDWLLAHPFLEKTPPKSTGRSDFGPHFVERYEEKALAKGLSSEDALATANAFTAQSVYRGCRRWLGQIDELIVSGGGTFNETLMESLEELFQPPVVKSSAYGIPVEAKEALGFAILAYETYRGVPSNVPAATGARHRTMLGKISPYNEVKGSA